jgi:urease accessory protein
MLQIRAKLKVPKAAYGIKTGGSIALSFAERSGRAAHARLESGEEVALMLPRGESLRGGDLVTASDGRVFEVVARKEKLLSIECGSPAALARIAWRLGSRHVPVEVGEGSLRVAADPGLAEMAKALGARVATLEAAFEPGEAERGIEVHGGGHDHDHEHCDHDHHAHPHR